MRPSCVRGLWVALLATLLPDAALACGCFLPPDPVQPLVQTGERIVFRARNGQITAHVQIAFAGKDTTQFGWTVPVPSVPTLEVGDDALFNTLLAETAGRYAVETTRCESYVFARSSGGYGCDFRISLDKRAAPTRSGSLPFVLPASPDIVVVRSTVGPYDFAVLKAESKSDLLLWLQLNRFFLPTASDELLKPYLGPGKYFLALKMQPGTDAGDIKPIVLRYASDLPMIPLTLTSATVAPRLPVQVWVIGGARAIPRNFHHVVLDDARLDWLQKVGNYDEAVARAVAEAPGGHGFVTEFAGPSAPLAARVPPALAPLFEGATTVTRLYSVLAQKSLDRDPVFSENPDLPPVGLDHKAVHTDCFGTGELRTPLGHLAPTVDGVARIPSAVPWAERVEILSEEGQPTVVTDNHALIDRLLGGGAPWNPGPDAGAFDGGVSDGGSADAGVGDGGMAMAPRLRGDLLLTSLLPLALVFRRRRRP